MGEPLDEQKLDMETGEKEETVYDEAGREKLVEDGEIEPDEAGFMEGAEDDGEQGKCAFCGAMILKDNTVEARINDKVSWFCSQEHAEKYREKHESAE
ncbi:hypothetical protein ACFL0V_07160 [Nanoarchaeota archaeon]